MSVSRALQRLSVKKKLKFVVYASFCRAVFKLQNKLVEYMYTYIQFFAWACTQPILFSGAPVTLGVLDQGGQGQGAGSMEYALHTARKSSGDMHGELCAEVRNAGKCGCRLCAADAHSLLYGSILLPYMYFRSSSP